MVKIDKNIPIPTLIKGLHYPWEELEVGDSFLILPFPGEPASSHRSRVKSLCSYHRKGDKNWAYRVTSDGVRVWRVA